MQPDRQRRRERKGWVGGAGKGGRERSKERGIDGRGSEEVEEKEVEILKEGRGERRREKDR